MSAFDKIIGYEKEKEELCQLCDMAKNPEKYAALGVRLPRGILLHGVPGETAAKRKKELFERFGIDKFAQTKIANLSTGMKQKVSIAISLAHDPEIIIFDEPTNGLDVLTAKTVTDFLTELKEQGKCILLSTHIFSLVEKICDRVGIIINGRMVADGSLKELTAEKNIEDLFFDIYKREVGEE